MGSNDIVVVTIGPLCSLYYQERAFSKAHRGRSVKQHSSHAYLEFIHAAFPSYGTVISHFIVFQKYLCMTKMSNHQMQKRELFYNISIADQPFMSEPAWRRWQSNYSTRRNQIISNLIKARERCLSI